MVRRGNILLTFALFSLAFASCHNVKKNKACAVSSVNKDSVAQADTCKYAIVVRLQRSTLSEKDTVLQYKVINSTSVAFTYTPDDYFIERYSNGRWQRLDNDFGSVLMEKEIAPRSAITANAFVPLKKGKLEKGKYRIGAALYRDGIHSDSTKIVATAEFTVR